MTSSPTNLCRHLLQHLSDQDKGYKYTNELARLCSSYIKLGATSLDPC